MRGRPPSRFLRFRQLHPEARFWLTAGLTPRAALALAGAGFHSLSDLDGVTREELLAIQDVGHRTLLVLDQVLGRQLPGRSVPAHCPSPWPEMVWRQRGLPAEAAITFAQMRMTLKRLKAMTREELLSLQGVGPRTLQACELILGQKILPRRLADPVVAFWRGQGLSATAALALREAGIRSIEELQALSREDLLALRGVGDGMLARIETLLGNAIPSRADSWRRLGLSAAVANVLVREGIHTLEDLGRLTREQLLSFRGIGYFSFLGCERVLGRRLPSDENAPRRRRP